MNIFREKQNERDRKIGNYKLKYIKMREKNSYAPGNK